MFRSYWLSVIAIGLALTAYAQAAPIKNASGSASRASETQTQSEAPTPAVPWASLQNDAERIAKALEAKNANDSSAEEDQRARDNLEAQQKMADAAHATVVVAILETCITLIGVLLVGWALYHTKRADDEAKRAADAARDSIAQSETFGRQELRAYVFVTAKTLDLIGETTARVKVVFRNGGATPAYSISAKFAVWTQGVNGQNKTFAPTDGSEVPPFTLGPSCEFSIWHIVDITSENLALIRGRWLGIFVGGEVTYSDAFQDKHRTTFEYYMSGPSIDDEDRSMSYYEGKNEAD